MKDWYAINEMWVSCPYFEDEFAVRGAKAILDIGAHIGAFSLLAASLTRGAYVFAYEPSPSTHRLLLDNISLNTRITQSAIVPCQSAVAGTRGVRKLYPAGTTAAGHSLCFGTVEESAEVQTVTLEDALDENSIRICDFLKLDCEGAEYEILLSSSKSCLRRIKMIAAECHQVPGQDADQLGRWLTEAGFAVRFRDIPLFSARFPAYRSFILLARNRTSS
jgi:FkbM family methyltransferase